MFTANAGLPFPIGTCTIVMTSRSVSVTDAPERSGSTRAPAVEASAARRVRQGVPFVDGGSVGVVRPTQSATANMNAMLKRCAGEDLEGLTRGSKFLISNPIR